MQVHGAFRQEGPDRLKARGGGGLLIFLGLPALVIGVVFLLEALQVITLEYLECLLGGARPKQVYVPLLFTVVGGVMVFGRRWLTVDASRGRVLRQWGLLAPMFSKTNNLCDYEAISLQLTEGDSETPDQYPVRLKGKSGGALTLYSSKEYSDSWGQAVALAELLRFPLEDATAGRVKVLSPDQVAGSFRQRASTWAATSRPISMRSEVQEYESEVRIKAPGPGVDFGALLPRVVIVGFLLYFGPRMIGALEHAHESMITFGLIAFFCGFLPLMALLSEMVRAVRSHSIIVVTPGALSITEQGAWRAKTTAIPAEDILDIDSSASQAVLESARRLNDRSSWSASTSQSSSQRLSSARKRRARSKGVTVKTRRGLFTFGVGLSHEEVVYLNAVLAGALGVGGSRP